VHYADYDKGYQNLYPSDEVVVTNGRFDRVELDGYLDTTQRENLILQANLVWGIQHRASSITRCSSALNSAISRPPMRATTTSSPPTVTTSWSSPSAIRCRYRHSASATRHAIARRTSATAPPTCRISST
jgi:hypothetical protein